MYMQSKDSCQMQIVNWFVLVCFYVISNNIGYLVPKIVYTYILNIEEVVSLGFMTYQAL